MKSAILANVALCLCPPLVATSVTLAVPPARHAVHKLTASKPKHHKSSNKAPVHRSPCAAAFTRQPRPLAFSEAPVAQERSISGLDMAPLEPAPSLPPSGGGSTTLVIGPGPLPWPPVGPGIKVNPVYPVEPRPPVTSVPEPASWLMMLAGFMAMGSILRRRGAAMRKQAISSAGAAAELGGSASLLLAPSSAASTPANSLAGHALAAALAKKAGLCVCAGTIMAAAVTTVPPVKRAVHAATAPTHGALQPDCSPD